MTGPASSPDPPDRNGWQLLEDSNQHGKNRAANYAIVDFHCKARTTFADR
jgi:hypothetical protein